MTAVGGAYPGELEIRPASEADLPALMAALGQRHFFSECSSDASATVVATAMKPPVIRPARPGDAADLARNWIDAARHAAELDSDAFQVPAIDGLAAWFEELLLRPRSADALWLVAELDGRVVGDVSARLERPAEDAERQLLRDLGRARLYVDALGVEASYRRRGVGAQLLRAAEEWGRDKGAVRSVLTTYHASPLSVPFYEQGMGYERRSIVFEKRLE